MSQRSRVAAWGVHLLTASGGVLGFLSVVAILRGELDTAWAWLFAALLVDGADGWMARWAKVDEVLPSFDGSLLDLIVDYFTYTVVPCLILHQAELIPDAVRLSGVILIILSTPYAYARLDIKTSDNYFSGFPAVWNVVIYYMYLLRLPAWANFGFLLLFVVLTFVPLQWVHPMRVPRYRTLTRAAAMIWIASNGWILYQLPERPAVWVAVSLLALVYMIGVGVMRSVSAARSG